MRKTVTIKLSENNGFIITITAAGETQYPSSVIAKRGYDDGSFIRKEEKHYTAMSLDDAMLILREQLALLQA